MYGKLFRQMYHGTLATVGPWQALVTFQQLIILADQDGNVDMTPEAIARETTIPLDVIKAGIESLEQPDPDSRTPAEEGRRIVRLNEHRRWGWRIVNHEHYRKIKREEDRREYHRQYWHKRKAKLNTTQHTQPNQPIAEAEAEAKNTEPTALVVLASPKRPSPCPTGEILNLYHSKLPTLPRVEVLTETRKKALASRWREVLADHDGDRNQAIEWFGWYFGRVAESKFLTGRNGKSWRAGFDWLVNPSNFAKVVEGNYSREAA